MCACVPSYLAAYLCSYLSMYLCTDIRAYLLNTYLQTYLPGACWSNYRRTDLPYRPTYQRTYLPTDLPTYLLIYIHANKHAACAWYVNFENSMLRSSRN